LAVVVSAIPRDRAAIVVDLVWIVLALAGLAVAVMPWTCATLADAE
jgi:hypothetical protein